MDDSPAVHLCCHDCGELPVPLSAVEVHLNPRESFALYTFACPRCGELGAGGDRDMVTALLEAGVRRYELRSSAAPPLTYDDLLDFHEWLEKDVPWPVDG